MLSMQECRAKARETMGNGPGCWATSWDTDMVKVDTGERAARNVWAVPESLEIGPWDWDFLGSSPQVLSAMHGWEQKASYGLNVHRSPIPIFNPLPSTGGSLVCEWSPRYPAAKPSMSHCHLGRAPSGQLDSSWYIFDVWFDFDFQYKTNWSEITYIIHWKSSLPLTLSFCSQVEWTE